MRQLKKLRCSYPGFRPLKRRKEGGVCFGAVLEEIVVEEPGDADEHVEVDAGAFEKTFTIASFIKYFVFLQC